MIVRASAAARRPRLRPYTLDLQALRAFASAETGVGSNGGEGRSELFASVVHTPTATREKLNKLEALVRDRFRPQSLPPREEQKMEMEKAHWQSDGHGENSFIAAGRLMRVLLNTYGFEDICKIAEELSRSSLSELTEVRNLFLKHAESLFHRNSGTDVAVLKEAVTVLQQWYDDSTVRDKRTYLYALNLAKLINEVRVRRNICEEVPPFVVGEECLPFFEDANGLQREPVNLFISSLAYSNPAKLLDVCKLLTERGDGTVESLDWNVPSVVLSKNAEELEELLSLSKTILSDGALNICIRAARTSSSPTIASALAEAAERGRDPKEMLLETWTSLCLLFGSHKQISGVFDTLGKMKQHYVPSHFWNGRFEKNRGGMQLSYNTCRIIAQNLFSSVEDVDNAYFELERRMKAGETLPDEAINIIIIGCGLQGSLERAYDTFAVLEELGFEKSIRCFDALLSACVDMSERNHAENVLEDIRTAGLRPSQATFHLLVRLYSEVEKPDVAVLDSVTRQALDDRVRLATATMKLIADTAIDGGDFRLARIVIDRLSTGNINCSKLRLCLDKASKN